MKDKMKDTLKMASLAQLKNKQNSVWFLENSVFDLKINKSSINRMKANDIFENQLKIIYKLKREREKWTWPDLRCKR